MHFYVEHNKGHHARVATEDDPASARFGETIFAFIARTLPGSYRSGWEIEVVRLTAQGRSILSLRNLMLWATLLPLTILLLALVFFGAKAALLFVFQSFVAVMLLETVNYIEHYGLQREIDDQGRYEKVTHRHSWNSNRRLTNLFLFNLQRHSHHHANVTRHYQSLEWFADSPQLPCGYSELILTAWIPPLWRRRIHPLMAAV